MNDFQITDPVLAQFGSAASWSYGNELFIFGSNSREDLVESEGKRKNISPKIHAVKWNTDIYATNLRKILNESHGKIII